MKWPDDEMTLTDPPPKAEAADVGATSGRSATIAKAHPTQQVNGQGAAKSDPGPAARRACSARAHRT